MSAAIAIYAVILTIAVLAAVAFLGDVGMPALDEAIRASFIEVQ